MSVPATTRFLSGAGGTRRWLAYPWGMIAAAVMGWLALTGEAAVPPDTPEERRAAAAEFLAVVPVGEEVDTLIHEISAEVAQERREWFVEEMNRQVDLLYVRGVMVDGLTANLSAAELRAAARFYGSPEGKAVREKLPKVTDGIMPLLREELVRAVRRLPH